MGGELARVCVYGTLRRGAARDMRVHFAGAQFVAPVTVRGALYDFGEYPGLRLGADGGLVVCELFDVPPATLAALDELEGFDPRSPATSEYIRLRVDVALADGSVENCWIYEIAESLCAGRPRIASGDWMGRGR